jgi:hypothetical protein
MLYVKTHLINNLPCLNIQYSQIKFAAAARAAYPAEYRVLCAQLMAYRNG